jgi:hypothetical protein
MSELEACPFCKTNQLEVVKIDMKDPDRDLIKCRRCRGQVMRYHWNTRHITLDQAKQVLAEAGMVDQNELYKNASDMLIDAVDNHYPDSPEFEELYVNAKEMIKTAQEISGD